MNLLDCSEERKPSVDLQEVKAVLQKAKIFACDLETSGLSFSEDRITIVAIAAEVDGKIKGWAIECIDYPIEEIGRELFDIFHDKNKTVVFHNASFDIRMLNAHGIYVHNRVADTMIMAWLYDEDRVRHGGYGLKASVLKHLNYKMSSYQEARSLFGDFEDYAADDAVQTLRLFNYFEEKLESLGLMNWFWQIEMPITCLLIETETRGVMLDKAQLKKIKREAWVEVEDLEQKIFKTVGYKFDVGSPKQWARILFDEMKVGMREDGTNKFSYRSEKGTKQWSTANAVLEAIRRSGVGCSQINHDKCHHFLGELLLKFREINTRLNVFIKPLLIRCRYGLIIHPRFIQIGTVTGRFASRDPNYQNLPRKGGIRKAFVARPGYKICKADYQQAELRLMAHMSNDPVMVAIYMNNGDIHQTTAEACGVSRQAAKEINFGLCYRMSANRLQIQLAIQGIELSYEECKKYVKRYFAKYKQVRNYHKRVERTVLHRLDSEELNDSSWVKSLGGRYRRLDRNYLTQFDTSYTAITKMINFTIQGGVSDLIKVAMVDCQNAFRKKGWLDPENGIWDACIQGQVHDEIFVECKEEIAEEVKEILTYCMENAGRKYKIKVPMTADAEIVDNLAK